MEFAAQVLLTVIAAFFSFFYFSSNNLVFVDKMILTKLLLVIGVCRRSMDENFISK